MRAERHPDEAMRLEALRAYGVLDTPRERDFDDLVALAAAVCEAPIALVSLLDTDRQWFKAEVGLGVSETPLDASICAHALLQKDVLEVPDTTLDARFRDNPLVTGEPSLRFYAGALLETAEGLPLGTLCVLDTKPRALTDLQRETLRVLARQVMAQLELRRAARELEAQRGARADGEAFLRLVTDRLPVRVGYLGPDYRFRFLNEAYELRFGLARGEGLGLSVAELAGEEAFRVAKPFIDRALAGETNEQEFTVRYPEGTRRIQAQYVADADQEGVVHGVVVHVLDVTERFEATEALREGEAYLRAVLDSSAGGFYGVDAEGATTVCNAAFLRMLGIGRVEDAVGRKLHGVIHHSHPDGSPYPVEECPIYLAARTGRAAHVAGELFFRLDGTPLPVEYWSQPIFRDGAAQGAVTTFVDITERKAAEAERERLFAELQIEREKLARLFENAPAFVAVLRGPELVFEHVNAAYYGIVGHRPIVGLPLAVAIPEAVGGGEGRDYDRLLRRIMERGEPETYRERPVSVQRTPGGATVERYLDLSYHPIREADGAITGVLVHGVDVTEGVEARKEIARREELFRTVFEQAPDDAILVLDANRTITAWNPAAERICGWSAAEAIGQTADVIFVPDDRASGVPEGEIAAAARDGKTADERWHLRNDGSRFWGSGTMNALHDESGAVRGYLKIFRDATERHVETQTLAFLRWLTDAIIDQRDADAILGTALRMLGGYLGASRATFGEFVEDEETFAVRTEWGPDVASVVGIYRLTDFGPGAVKALRAGQTYVVRDVDREEPQGAQAARAVEALAGISVPVLKDGRLAALVVVHQSTRRDWTDDEIGLVRQVADRIAAEIERARAEAALRTSEERLRQLVELSPATVWFGETDGGLSYISPDFYETTGLIPDQAMPNGWVSTVHPEDVARVAGEWETARRGEAAYDTEFRIRNRHGAYRWISARALPVRDAEGRVTGWLGSNSDIQERKETEETLQARVAQRTEELQRAVREAEGFNYSISHDLRTPLRAMVSTSGILLEEAGAELSEEHRGLLVRQSENAKRLGRLIDELLRLSRLARVEVHRERLDMTRKARAVVSEIEQSGGANGCRVEIQEDMTAEGDPGLVRTVFQNLIGNACKFSPRGGRVAVRQDGDIFAVVDEGVGFDMQFAPKIFLPFERLVTDAEFSGTGIGLANVKRIVERHGGRVWVESAPGAGATFYFTLNATSS